jgi:hypothetical protein
MNIAQLHHILHPKLGPYSGSGSSYQHPLSTDMCITIKKQAENIWIVSLFERGEKVSEKPFRSETLACENILKIVRQN